MRAQSDQTCEDLLLLLRHLKAVLMGLAEQRGLTMVQMSALYSIDQYGELAMGKVADVLHCDASNVTGIVDRLVSSGLITRHESERDRRTKTLRLTPKGQETVTAIKAVLPACMGCDRLSNEERETLHVVAQKVSS